MTRHRGGSEISSFRPCSLGGLCGNQGGCEGVGVFGGLPLSLDAAISHSGASFLQWPHLSAINRSVSGLLLCLGTLLAAVMDVPRGEELDEPLYHTAERTQMDMNISQNSPPSVTIYPHPLRPQTRPTMSLLSSTISLKLSAVSSTTSLDDRLPPPPLGLGRSLDPPPLLGLDLDPPARQRIGRILLR